MTILRRPRLLILTEQLQALLSAAEGKSQEAVAQFETNLEREHALPLEFGPPSIYKTDGRTPRRTSVGTARSPEAREAFQVALARAPGRRSVVQALARADKEIASAK